MDGSPAQLYQPKHILHLGLLLNLLYYKGINIVDGIKKGIDIYKEI
jgi:hypothetical protein